MLMQPGDTITPQAQQPEPEQQIAQPMQQAPVQAPAEPIPPAAAAVPDAPPQTVPSEFIPPAPSAETAPPATDPTALGVSDGTAAIQWTASEYVDHAKGPAWFALMGFGLFVIVVLVYLVLKDVLAAILLGLAGITFGIFSGRRPQVLQYAIDSQGIHIGNRLHAFEDFKSFTLTGSGPLPAILLTPLKRFLPPITVFYDPKEEDRIIDALADYLPHEDKEPDMIDRLMSRIRF